MQQQQQPGHGGHQQLPALSSLQLETLSHMFVDCPVAAAAWTWFAQVWHRVQPGAQVDYSDVRVLLLDDCTVWQTRPALQQLWTYMRLLMLQSMWSVRCGSNGKQYSTGQVVGKFKAALQQQLKQDWLRTQGDIRLNSGVPLSWLRGRNPVMSQEKFAAKWQGSGVLYTDGGEGPRLCFE